MMFRKFLLGTGVACLVVCATSAMADTVGFTVAGTLSAAGVDLVNLGLQFTPTANISVDALGFYDGNDVTADETVGLYTHRGPSSPLLPSRTLPRLWMDIFSRV